MLVCPQCQFENPNTNNFCQRCGTSLTHKACHDCGTQVAIDAETCDNCGAFTGTIWWAIITRQQNARGLATDALNTPPGTSELAGDNAQGTTGSQLEIPLATEASAGVDEWECEASPTENSSSVSQVSAWDASSPNPLKADDFLAESSLTPAANEERSLGNVTPPQVSPSQLSASESTSQDNNDSKIPSAPGEDAEGPVRVPEVNSGTQQVIYLDSQQRYRLLEEPTSLLSSATGGMSHYATWVRVLDCQPLQKSPLEALMEQRQINQQFESQEEPDSTFRVSTIPPDAWKALGIPAIAQPYIALHDAYYPTLPAVHDAWEQDGKAVVLLEDRSEWQLLGELWGSVELSSLQILYWLDEMAKLWQALEPWHYRQSLLEPDNLRVDEDQVLALVCLYPEVGEEPPTLQELGKMWQTLFDQSQRTQFTALGAVFRQMCTNEITTISEVRSQLEAIAHEQQASVVASTPYADSAREATTPEIQAAESDDPAAGVPTKPALYDPSSSNESDDLPTVILPMQLLSLDDVGCTDIGQQRQHNEDHFGIQTQIKKHESPHQRAVEARGLYVLCDGMGGHAAGEVASAMAVETLDRYFQDNWHQSLPNEESIREAVRLANQSIFDVNQKNSRSGSGRMGTTLAMILIHDTEAAIAHVGDSRVYRLTRKRGLEQLTVDHEVGQREIMRGVDPQIAYSRPDAYQLTQALGPRSEQFINPDIQFLELNEDSLFVLCSDGLSDNDLIETHWQTHLAPLLSSRANLDQGILQLIELANKYNGHDNITAILIRVKVRPNFEQQQLR